MEFNEKILNIIFFARGGQGAKTATEILAQAGIMEGKFVKAFPEFGPERSGAPIKTYLRISSSEIRTAEPITKPSIIIVLDKTVLDGGEMTKNLEFGEDILMIINTRKEKEEIKKLVPSFKGKIYTIDASTLALKIIGKPTPNVAILGYLVKITELVKLSNVSKAIENIFTDKIGKELTQKNILAMEKAYDSI
ncbi:MAG: 2-oxoacid:acceptor oxidoreductase family protein [Patescibacteria group bacterium]